MIFTLSSATSASRKLMLEMRRSELGDERKKLIDLGKSRQRQQQQHDHHNDDLDLNLNLSTGGSLFDWPPSAAQQIVWPAWPCLEKGKVLLPLESTSDRRFVAPCNLSSLDRTRHGRITREGQREVQRV